MRYFLLGLLLLLCSTAQGQNLEQGTTKASALFTQAEALTPQGKFDSASLLYHKAASLVKPHKLWKKYFTYTLKQGTVLYYKGFLLYAMEREREALEVFSLAVQLIHLGISNSERTADKLKFAEQGYDAHRQAAYLHFLEAKSN